MGVIVKRGLFVLSGLVLLALSFGRGYRVRDEGTASALGHALGALLFYLLLAWGLRAIYVRYLAKNGQPARSPWLIVVAASISVLVIPSTFRADREEDRENAASAISAAKECRRVNGSPFRRLPSGLRYTRLSPSQKRGIGKIVPEEFAAAYEARNVLSSDGGFAGVVLAAGAGDPEKVERGFVDGAQDQGVELRDVQFSGHDARVGDLAGGPIATATTACELLVIFAVDNATRRRLAEPLIGAAP